MAIWVIGCFLTNTQIIDLWHEGLTILMQCLWEFVGDFFPTKSHLLRICSINSFLVNREDVKFFDGLPHISCLGWEVKIYMSGQSNDQLDLDGAHTCIPVLVQVTCIWANTAWIFPKMLLAILYHKLSIIMLIRMSTVCFKWYWTYDDDQNP